MNNVIRENKLKYMEFINRENQYRHHYYDEEMLQYELLKKGDPKAIEESTKMFSSPNLGHLSNNPLRNIKYMFIASITLATRFAIEGGMNSEKAYNASDLYIQNMDNCQTIEEVKKLQTDMFTFFTKQVSNVLKETVYSKPVIQSMDYIYEHLYENINVSDVAKHVHLNSSYLSTLFKKETNIALSDYVRKKRVKTAENMLKFSDYSFSEISAYLSFSSQSYFIRVFKTETGYTPKQYRKLFYRNSF